MMKTVGAYVNLPKTICTLNHLCQVMNWDIESFSLDESVIRLICILAN